MLNLSNVLITGADGMVGSYINFGMKTSKSDLDVTNPERTLEVAKERQPEAIIHLAAQTDVNKCEREPAHCYLVNSVGTYNIAAAAREAGAKLVYISTIGVFDGKKSTPYNEADTPNPQNHYGRSKYLGELIVQGMLKNYLILRTNWIFGGGPGKDQKFVAKVIKQINNPEIKAVTDSYGSPTYGKDLVEIIRELLQKNETGIFHVTNKGWCSRYELAREIADILKSNVKIISVDSSYFGSDVKWDNLKSESLEINTVRPWQEALKEYIETEWQA